MTSYISQILYRCRTQCQLLGCVSSHVTLMSVPVVLRLCRIRLPGAVPRCRFFSKTPDVAGLLAILASAHGRLWDLYQLGFCCMELGIMWDCPKPLSFNTWDDFCTFLYLLARPDRAELTSALSRRLSLNLQVMATNLPTAATVLGHVAPHAQVARAALRFVCESR